LKNQTEGGEVDTLASHAELGVCFVEAVVKVNNNCVFFRCHDDLLVWIDLKYEHNESLV